jgi:hypothetical protein
MGSLQFLNFSSGSPLCSRILNNIFIFLAASMFLYSSNIGFAVHIFFKESLISTFNLNDIAGNLSESSYVTYYGMKPNPITK